VKQAAPPERYLDRSHPICDYEGTSYRARFWDGQGREYEDLAERIALGRLLPPRGRRIVEIGAGFGRLADLYDGYEQVILLDYARSGLREAQARLGCDGRFVYVAADLYRLPLAAGSCDTAVTVRVLHHVQDVPAALSRIAATVRPGGTYILEYANKRNLKAVARYLLGRQAWSPFAREPYEFVELNYDFHPQWMAEQLLAAGFAVEKDLAVSLFRQGVLKRRVPAGTLAAADGAFQRPGAGLKLAPSVFVRARRGGDTAPGGDTAAQGVEMLFRCPDCGSEALQPGTQELQCPGCGRAWPVTDGIYDFK
jgi:SAM-dependent methyltransferase